MSTRGRPVYVHLVVEARLDAATPDLATVRIHRDTGLVHVRVRRSRKRHWTFRLGDLLQIGVTRAIKAECERRLSTARKEQ